jgi:hypothetical protein
MLLSVGRSESVSPDLNFILSRSLMHFLITAKRLSWSQLPLSSMKLLACNCLRGKISGPATNLKPSRYLAGLWALNLDRMAHRSLAFGIKLIWHFILFTALVRFISKYYEW